MRGKGLLSVLQIRQMPTPVWLDRLTTNGLILNRYGEPEDGCRAALLQQEPDVVGEVLRVEGRGVQHSPYAVGVDDVDRRGVRDEVAVLS